MELNWIEASLTPGKSSLTSMFCGGKYSNPYSLNLWNASHALVSSLAWLLSALLGVR